MRNMVSRRAVLRGAGVALCLPWLESLAPRSAGAQAAAVPKRFIPIYFPGGAAEQWRDITVNGTEWTLSRNLEPLTPLKSKIQVVRNLGNYTWRTGLTTMNPKWYEYQTRQDTMTLMPNGAYTLPSHSRDPGALLTCVDGDELRRKAGLDVATAPYNSITADQVIAQALAAQPATKTALPSMQLGLLNGTGEFDGRNSNMSQTMSWADSNTPMGKELDPQKIFDKLVAAGAVAHDGSVDPNATAEAAKRRALKTSALDSLKSSATTLQGKLAKGDRDRLDEFLTGVRELEKTIGDGGNPVTSAACAPIAAPGSVTDPDQKAKVMNQLITMALQCDVTRVISYMLDNSRSDMAYVHVKERDFDTVGSPLTGATCGSYHGSQHGGLRNKTFASIVNWHTGIVADLATRLDAIPEGNGTLLDNSVLLYFSDCHHGDHAGFDIPCVLLGGGSGTLKTNQYVVLPENPVDSRQCRDLYFTLFNEYFQLGIKDFGSDERGIPNALLEGILA